MKIINGIEFGLTSGGYFYEIVSDGSVNVARATPDPERFLKWIIQHAIDESIESDQRNLMISIIKPWWLRSTAEHFRGTFNEDLYLKIIEAKKRKTKIMEDINDWSKPDENGRIRVPQDVDYLHKKINFQYQFRDRVSEDEIIARLTYAAQVFYTKRILSREEVLSKQANQISDLISRVNKAERTAVNSWNICKTFIALFALSLIFIITILS